MVPHEFAFNEGAAPGVLAQDSPHVGILEEDEIMEEPLAELLVAIVGAIRCPISNMEDLDISLRLLLL